LIQTPADAYHAHDEATLPACFIASLLRRKRLVFDAHELPLDETSIRWPWLLKLFSYLLAFILPRCAGIITVSEPIAQEIRKRYHTSEITVVRNILPYKSVPKSDLLRQSLDLGSDVRIALYQGSLQANRGLAELIRAAPFLDPDIVIIMLGKGNATELVKLEAIIAEVGLPDRVRILPAVPYAELLNWTASADIGLIVNPPEISLNVQMCLPNKFFEYLMVGLPVLSTALDVVGEIIRAYDVGRVMIGEGGGDGEGHRSVVIGEAINVMLADAQGLVRMHGNALAVVRDEFCWEKERMRLICLYRGILAWQCVGEERAGADQLIRAER
jgi:glycosyltransferase involved in cell wall biosynthesis